MLLQMTQGQLSHLLFCLTVILSVSSSTRVERQTQAAVQFQVEPRRALVAPDGSVTIVGRAGTPLQVCHFYLPGAIGRLVDLSQGHGSASTAHHEYAGAGLQSGECGIKIKKAEDEDDGIIECKVKAVGGGAWLRSVTTLRVTDLPAQSLPVFNIVPQRAVLLVGDSLTVTCNADQPITLCHIYLPGGRLLNYDRGADSEQTGSSRYHGSGLEGGECGATLTGVDRRLNGFVVCKVGDWPDDLSGAWETDALDIVTTSDVSLVNRFPTQTVTQPRPTPKPTTTAPFTAVSACPALTSSSLLISCSFAGEETDCSQPQDIGTTASLDCKPGYVRAGAERYTSTICKRGGRWDRPLFVCTTDCGRRHQKAEDSLTVEGQSSEVGEFPWNVGVYAKHGEELRQVCEGSLIAPSFVVSAAHCFWNHTTANVRNKQEFRIAAGKHSRNWGEAESGAQTRTVSAISVPRLFNGRLADIAVVRVDKPFEVTSSVNLVCVDWDNLLEDRQLTLGAVGVVPGWGYTEDGHQSDTLMYHNLPFVPRSSCLGVIPPSLRRRLTHDKFCAGRHNHTTFCAGNSGGGLTFKRADTDRYYLRGVASLAFVSRRDAAKSCEGSGVVGFTRFSAYKEWVAEQLHS